MSMYTAFKRYDEVIEYLSTVDHPKCFTVNYKPDIDKYALWIGSQPYYVYEDWIEEIDQLIKELKKENKELEELVSSLRWKLLSKILKLKKYDELIEDRTGDVIHLTEENEKLKLKYKELMERVEVIQNVVGFKL
jgi:hypothetical protein